MDRHWSRPVAGAPAEPIAARALNVVTTVVAPVTLIVGLLTYFGWTRTGAIYGYFGIDQAVLGLSIQEYLVRSGGVIFRPAAMIATAAVATIMIDLAVGRVSRPGVRRTVLKALAAVGTVLTTIGLMAALALPVVHIEPMLGAWLLGSGALAIAIVIKHVPSRNLSRMGAVILVFVIVLISLFWGTSIYASRSGTDVADEVNRYPGSRPEVTVFSKEPLDFGDSAVQTQVPAGDGSYRYRYGGMRLFSYANDRWFLITGQRDGGRLSVNVLHDTESVSVTVHGT